MTEVARATMMEHTALLERLAVCCRSGDNMVAYWSTLLIHSFAQHGKANWIVLLAATECAT